ncbi:MAG: hypothetical protein LBC11_01205 [Puniceicoccales bacterium]|jgi:hypothetical protein|nr:hypothetical protein [Puniceicoccales bacterium]
MNAGNVRRNNGNDGVPQVAQQGHQERVVQVIKEKIINFASEVKREVTNVVLEARESSWIFFQKAVLLVTVMNASIWILQAVLRMALIYGPEAVSRIIIAGLTTPRIQAVVLVTAAVATVVATMVAARKIWRAMPVAEREAVVIVLTILSVVKTIIRTSII